MRSLTKTYSRGGGTICDKHDGISEACINLITESKNYTQEKLLSEVETVLGYIIDIIDAAKKDGQNMEDSLIRKKDRIEELEREVSDRDDHIQELENNS
jgi:hypothetical protein